MRIEIAGVRLALEPRDTATATLLSRTYAGGAADAQIDLAVDLGTGHAPRARDVGLVVEGRRGRYMLEDVTMHGTVDVYARRASVTYDGNVASIASFLEAACALALAATDGFLVHGSSVVRGGRAYLFVGRHAIDPTSYTQLGADCIVLSERVSAVRKSADGFLAHPTGFGGVPDAVGAKTPVGAIFFAAQSHDVRPVPMTPGEALANLLHSLIHFGDDAVLMGNLFDTCTAFVRDVRSAHTVFRRRDASFWKMVSDG